MRLNESLVNTSSEFRGVWAHILQELSFSQSAFDTFLRPEGTVGEDDDPDDTKSSRHLLMAKDFMKMAGMNKAPHVHMLGLLTHDLGGE